MKLLTTLVLAVAVADAHYTFPRLVVNGQSEPSDWYATRMTKNAQSKEGVLSPSNSDIRCYSTQRAANVLTVPAGATVSYISSQQVNHPGPTQYWIAKVPSGQSATSWDGSGAVWARLSTTTPTVDQNKQQHWPGEIDKLIFADLYRTVDVKIPASIANGEYLLRVEQIALHMAQQPGGAQFYLACSQIKITGGGSGTPGPLVSLPGGYSNNDPGIVVDIWGKPLDNYRGPGPAIWTG
ncbi:putative endo-beta-1,4-glucanase D [Paramyrothecium foliicola]|nr:putative endo-beta-1,4-glucanase D [Paramyrothecium foliicola]